MEMIGSEDTEGLGEDLTPQLPPLAFSLFDSSLTSRCSSCFRPLPTHPHSHTHTHTHRFLHYCSSSCSSADSSLHHSSAEHHLLLLLLHPSTTTTTSTSDLRTALRLLHHFQSPHSIRDRFLGLLSNYHKFNATNDDEEEEEILLRVREGARLMSMARRMRDGQDVCDVKGGGEGEGNYEEEEMALCVVLTNGVEVQVDEKGPIGIAVYGPSFSWINHSCSPNAFYRFSIAGSLDSGGSPRMRIVGSGDETILREWTREESELGTGDFAKFRGNGPRVIVRSIKPIRKGEEVCVTYTDLLQPKAMRQSELWLKYKFICQCKRCASTPSFVDCILQGSVIPPNLESMNSSCNHGVYADEAYSELSACMDEAISDYLSVEDPEPCIEKLENILIQSLQEEPLKTQQSRPNLRLHPLHHLSLNAYITLSSAYKVCARNSLASPSVVNGLMLSASDLNRTIAAYSLLLSGAVHHLFRSEFSLIALAAYSWISAGESLLNLGGSMVSNSFLNRKTPDLSLSPLPHCKHSKCPLIDTLLADLDCQQSQSLSAKGEFHEISEGFIHCVSRICSRVWPSMIQGRHYLKDIKDPIDYSWLLARKSSNQERSSAVLDSGLAGCSENGVCWGCRCTAEDCTEDEKTWVFQLGAHCLLYGGYLVSICYGRQYHLYNYVRYLSVDQK